MTFRPHTTHLLLPALCLLFALLPCPRGIADEGTPDWEKRAETLSHAILADAMAVEALARISDSGNAPPEFRQAALAVLGRNHPGTNGIPEMAAFLAGWDWKAPPIAPSDAEAVGQMGIVLDLGASAMAVLDADAADTNAPAWYHDWASRERTRARKALALPEGTSDAVPGIPSAVDGARAKEIAYESAKRLQGVAKETAFVRWHGNVWIVTFPAPPPPSEKGRWCGPDFTARVTIDAESGGILEFLVGS